jgi:hypothetical protein
MPYGTAKARDGDPHSFIFHDLHARHVSSAWNPS